ncbi:unnamed protein product [Arabidopsis thaliana]|uniref:Uncharacterized protein n=1 Tax=Arabidopsis thaliana TaxID=3702 RepID=A0A5S9XJ69_ARATH|nr:unnamed protein product [Arabidopsis thaliana]
MEIETRPHISGDEKEEEQPLSPAARLFHAPEFNCNIISVIGFKSKLDPCVFIRGFKESFIRHPRFSSKLVTDENGQNQRWVRTNVVVEDHFIVPKIKPQNIENSNAFLEDYVSDLMKIPLDTSRPLWELHLLDLKTSDAENVAVLKIHHSVGDGMSIMSLVLACMRKTSNPDELPSLPYQYRSSSRSSLLTTGSRSDSRLLWLVKVIWTAVILGLNTVCDALEFIVTTLFVKDTETPIKGDFLSTKSKQLRLVHRTVSLDDIKLTKNAMNMTINDVVLGVTQAGLSRYLARRYGEEETKNRKQKKLPKRIRLRSALLVNLRPTTGIQDLADMMEKGSKCRWGNWFGYVVFPFSIALRDDPLEHLEIAQKTISRKKNSYGAMLTYIFCRIIVKLLGIKVAATIINRMVSNTTMTFSNMVGPVEEVSFYGHPITYFASSAYGHPHALTIHCQSYMNKMTITLIVDPTVISDPHRLCDDWEESLRSIKAAVTKRESLRLWDYLRILHNRVAWLLYQIAGLLYRML